MTNSLKINDTTVDQVYDTILKAGVADTDAKLLVSNWIFQHYRSSGRTFSYATPFPEAVPECSPPPFQRTFVHKDWLDGEDLVQAGETATDEGFNKRLHAIEADLDALGSGMAKLVDCLADLRAGVRKALDEVAAELNRIDNDIAPKSNVIVDPVFTRPGIDVAVPPSRLPGAIFDPVIPNPRSNYLGPMPAGFSDDPMFRFLGSTMVENKPVSLFSSSRGVVVLPTVDASAATVGQRVASPGAVAEVLHDNPDVKNATENGVTKTDLIERFGNLSLSNGVTLRKAVDVLPDDAAYPNADAMLKDLSDRTANVIEATEGASIQLANNVNVPAAAGTLGGADVASLPDIPTEAATKLKDAGISTIGQLAAAEPAKIADVLSNIALSEGKVAALRGTARTFSKVGLFH